MSKKLTELTAYPSVPVSDDLLYMVNGADSYKLDFATLFSGPVFIENLGTNWNTYALGAGLFRTIRVLTNDQIKGLPNTGGPLEIVPTPGAGKFLFPTSAVLSLDWTTDYASIDANAIMKLATDGGFSLLEALVEADSEVSSLLANGEDTFATMVPFKNLTNTALFVDKPLQIRAINGGVDFTAGNAANTLTVTVDYSLIDV